MSDITHWAAAYAGRLQSPLKRAIDEMAYADPFARAEAVTKVLRAWDDEILRLSCPNLMKKAIRRRLLPALLATTALIAPAAAWAQGPTH